MERNRDGHLQGEGAAGDPRDPTMLLCRLQDIPVMMALLRAVRRSRWGAPAGQRDRIRRERSRA